MSDNNGMEDVSSSTDKEVNTVNDDKEKNEIYSTKRKITHIIRQNPLVHLGEKSEKPTFFEKVKRAFSTEDTYSGGFIQDEEPYDGGLLGDKDDIFGDFVNKLKNAKALKDKKSSESSNTPSNFNSEEEIKQKPAVESSTSLESEEEFEIISSFLDSDSESEAAELSNEFNESNDPEIEIISREAVEPVAKLTEAAVNNDDGEYSEVNQPLDGERMSTQDDFSRKVESDELSETVSEKTEDLESVPVEFDAEYNQENVPVEFNTEDNRESVPVEFDTENEVISDIYADSIINTPELEDNKILNDKNTVNVSDQTDDKITNDSNVDENKESVKDDKATVGDAVNNSVKKVRNTSAAVAGKVKNVLGSAIGKLGEVCTESKLKLIELWNQKDLGKDEALTEESENTLAAEIYGGDVSDETKSNEAELVIASESRKKAEEVPVYESSEKANARELSDDESEEKIPTVEMKVIKNESSATIELDAAEVRKNLNIIVNEEDKSNDDFEILLEEPSILTSGSEQSESPIENKENEAVSVDPVSEEPVMTEDEQRQQADNRKVLDKVKEYEQKSKSQPMVRDYEKSAKAYEKEFGEVKPVTQIEVTNYLPPGQAEEIKVKAGKFSESVRAEYEFYIGYKRLQSVAKKQSKSAEQPITDKNTSDFTDKSSDYYEDSFENLSSVNREKSDDASVSNKRDKTGSKQVEYKSEKDQDRIKKYILKDLKKSRTEFTVSLFVTAAMFILFCFKGKFAATTAEMSAGETGAERVFALLNLLLFSGVLFVCRDILKAGLLPLKKLKVSADTSLALACVVTAFQAVLVLIAPVFFFTQSLNVYTLLATLALTLNACGRYLTAKRAKSNFAFVISSFNKYTARFYHDPRMTAKILSNTSIKSSKIVFQKRTNFLKNFIKLTYADDEGENMSVKFVLPATVISVTVSIIYAVLSKSFMGAFSVLSVMLCMAVPLCCRLLGALPTYQLSKNALKNQAMVVGYPAVEHFSDSCAIMIDAKELYPEGSVHMNGIKTFSGRKIDDALFAAAAVMVNAGGAMAGMFDGIIQGKKEDVLPPVESLVYEDEKGLIGWVNNERVLVGNRFLLEKHGIEPPSMSYEKKYRSNGDEILYLATSGELVAMFIIGYSANRRVMDALRRMESNGMSLLIRTVDVNITPERISRDFGIYHETVKILPTALGNIIRDEMIGKEKEAPTYIATKGGVVPLGRAVSGCIKAKRDISLSIAIQIIGVLISLLLVTMIVLFAGIQQIGAMELFVFSLFWVAAVAVVPIIQKTKF